MFGFHSSTLPPAVTCRWTIPQSGRWTAYPLLISEFTHRVSSENKHTHTSSRPSFVPWTFRGQQFRRFFGCHASPNPRSNALLLMPASNEIPLVPAWPRADGLVQHGITPADAVACQTGGHRPGHAKLCPTVPPYGNSVHWDHIGWTDIVECMAWFACKSE